MQQDKLDDAAQDWFIETLGIYPSHQYEFARLNLTYTLMSKRKLLELVQKGLVSGWDDPRMPTLCGVRMMKPSFLPG